MKVVMDDREPRCMEVFCAAEGLEVERKRLKIGDYVCEELGVCIERKTIDDFCGSIVDGRMKDQVVNMIHNYPYCYVLVSGKIKDRTAEIHENCILGMMVSLIVKHEVNLVCLDDDVQLVWFMKRLFERHKEVAENGRESSMEEL